MLPSRGLAKSPASALRYSFSSRTKPTRTILARQFSQAHVQPQSRLSASSRHALYRGNAIPFSAQIASSPSTIGYGPSIGIASSSVFAQRSGATRNLSLWPFSKSTDTQKNDVLSESAASPSSASDAASSGIDGPAEPVESVQSAQPVAPVEEADVHADSVPPPTTPEIDLSRLPDDLLREFEAQSLLDTPERLGFLREFGLDYGYGPTSCCQWLLEHIYIYTGMPWWGSIAAIAFLFRAVLFFPTLTATKHQALLQKAHKSPAFLQEKAKFNEAAFRTKDQIAMMTARARMKQITKESGASMWRPFIGFALVPFSFGMFRLVRGMSSVPVPSLETGGLAWFTDLTVQDPFYILPTIAISLAVLTLKQTQRTRIPDPTQDAIMKSMLYIMPPLMFVGTAWLPAALQWFFVAMSLGTAVQTSATLHPTIRRWAGLSELTPGGGMPGTGQFPGSGAQYQKPTERVVPATFRESIEAAGETMKAAAGATPQKAQWRRAKAYEEKRAQEEREKTLRRLEEVRRRRAPR